MDTRNVTQQRIPPNTSAAMDPTEKLPPDVDEPPDERDPRPLWTPGELQFATSKVDRSLFNRRESLLTRQLHSETEHTDDEDSRAPPRTLSTQSTWSNPSVASTAELTSDDGHSVASPAISPPLPPTAVKVTIPIMEKPLAREPHILGQEDKVPETGSEKSVEAGLGRKRCISFACGNKDKKPPTSQPAPQPAKVEEHTSSASPPKRKCMLKFVCPSRPSVERKPSEKSLAAGKRPVSPPPERKASASAKAEAFKAHRGSDSTVTHASPQNSRKSPAIVTTAPTPTTTIMARRKLSNDSDASTEATRFHEFASSDGEPEEWVQESTCHRSRLTVSDTLKKENILRKACEEVEEEVVEEEEEEDEEADLEDEEDNDDDEEDQDEEEESDDGFRTDDEDGFAESDSEGEESDGDWWRPGGISTAATSVDHLERLTLTVAKDDPAPSSSVASVDSSHISPRAIKAKSRRKHHSHAVPIKPRSEPMDLPDSTDFVCGTLDEDRPLEQAFLNQLKLKEAAKHKARPQDIDPTFPTSDPEMDEEDDEDLEDSEESERENLMHGELDELDGDLSARHRAASPRTRTRSNSHRSPPPPRHRSPAPAALKRQGTARSPPPPARRGTARSPPPRKLFGQSPKRSRSPAPVKTMTSPPNTRRASPISSAIKIDTHVLASRPQLTHTASLPRGGFKLGKMSKFQVDDREGSDTEHANTGDVPKRGAIDIYKGLEKKRQRRKEKLYQKLCAKAAAKGEKAYKVKPGKGAERMRELGLELQRYHGKGEHILSM
ncbi:hypothetical protein M409DRAFT_63537 [Zasmidium cellare ATCC 36951]|uniref:Extensin domain-containing protein n=1 Tax=Zasmidium cellare ATCC 36951 TaxID=1080233 RepID=A0A6A6D303_ZASCE|nr:uncharacterized protein M409DRAFT_63537 [Zasmidium cellare ATCC 36951]KAF2172036.1 hypothetical protein M409DRAFT_63537 [Zasmidium cellare ATCC 36951]